MKKLIMTSPIGVQIVVVENLTEDRKELCTILQKVNKMYFKGTGKVNYANEQRRTSSVTPEW